jgi:spore germination protein
MAESTRHQLYVVLMLILIALGLMGYYLISKALRRGDIGMDFSTIPLEKLKVKFFGWVTESKESVDSFTRNAAHFTWVSPTGSYVNSSGYFVGSVDQNVIEIARAINVSVIPLVANADFDNDLMHRILTDQATRNRTIADIVEFVLDGSYSGINVDWENIPAGDREALNSYMKELGGRLHDHGKLVTIDVSGKTSDETTGWSGAWDYKALGGLCDYICIMVYDYHYSGSTAGPVGPLGWLRQVVQYALSSIPRERIVIGIPFYGYDWIGNKGEYVNFDQALSKAKEEGSKVTFSEEDAEYTYTYDVFITHHEVWFQGAKSAEVKISSVLDSGIDKIAAWSVGQEDPRTWEVINRKP